MRRTRLVKELLQYKKGSLRIRVTGGSYDRFLNLCANHGIALWNLEYHDGAYEMDISLAGFRMLRPLSKKSSSRVRILKRHGLPFFLYRYRKRKMLFAGMFFGIVLMYGLSCFLWNIDVEGNGKITDGQIYRYLESVDITNGMRLSKIDCKALAAMLRKEFDVFTWVSVKQEGTRLLVQVKENTDAKEVLAEQRDGTPSDLVADKNGTIVSMITRKGVPQAAAGDVVKKGDLLVKGVLEIVDDAGEVTGYQFCHADADIFLKTSYEYEDRIALTRKEKQYTGKKKREYYMKAGSCTFSLPHGRNTFAAFDTVTDIDQLCFFQNFYLPVSLGKKEYLEYENVTVKLDEKTAASEAEDHLYKFLTEIQEKGVQIFENNVKIGFDEKYCIAKGSVILIEKAGKSVERTTAE